MSSDPDEDVMSPHPRSDEPSSAESPNIVFLFGISCDELSPEADEPRVCFPYAGLLELNSWIQLQRCQLQGQLDIWVPHSRVGFLHGMDRNSCVGLQAALPDSWIFGSTACSAGSAGFLDPCFAASTHGGFRFGLTDWIFARGIAACSVA